VTFYRRPLPCEKLTETVDPFLPAAYDDLLLLGTKAFMFRDRYEATLQGSIQNRRYIPGPKDMIMAEYKARLEEIRQAITARRVVYPITQPGGLW
jgi:hypothetical protein